jgi:hypothetical protein
VPCRHHDELPHDLGRTIVACEKPLDERRDPAEIERPAADRCHLRNSLHRAAQRGQLAQIARPRHAESPFFLAHDGERKPPRGGPPQQLLALKRREQLARFKCRDAFDEPVVEKRDAAFDRRPHRHPIVAIEQRAQERVLVAEHRLTHQVARIQRFGLFPDLFAIWKLRGGTKAERLQIAGQHVARIEQPGVAERAQAEKPHQLARAVAGERPRARRRQHRAERFQECGVAQRLIADVAAKELVGAFAREQHRHDRLRVLGDRAEMDVARVRERRTVQPRGARQPVGDGRGRKRQLVGVEAPRAHHFSSGRPFVESGLAKADGEARHAVAGARRERRGDAAGIESAAEQHADGNVADPPHVDRIVECLLEPTCGIAARQRSELFDPFAEAPPAPDLHPPTGVAEGMPWEQALDADKRRPLAGDVLEAQ